jgi:hypothetical protein
VQHIDDFFVWNAEVIVAGKDGKTRVAGQGGEKPWW